MNEAFEVLKKELPGLQKNVLLKDHTTFKIGGPAEYFFIAKKKEDVERAIRVAQKLTLPLFIFGGGSNLLVSDAGQKGLVVRMQSGAKTFALLPGNCIRAYAGVSLSDVVLFSIKKSLGGLEWAGGLPGTFGGAIRGNAGAFGGEVKDSIISVQAFDDHFTLRNFTNAQCKFSYRSSIFKEKGWTIISATVALKKGNKKELRSVVDSRINYRKEKHPLEYPSAGSVFKNVDVKKIPTEFKSTFLDKIKKDPFPIVPAAWFIIGAGLTGAKIGQAQISNKHSNYIVNLGGAKAQDVLQLIQLVKDTVKKKYGIELEQEIQYLK
ncbi:MAG: UDP-N-acetylenolpyruvoylglucosamine reductase [Candidatus Staskawiczbacteria bacterium RIFCSPHIGHO2_02_FULL_42_22]|uniref:UDP-N-acetylenolpyruvoylglucosamine reductase n=1 Tax=Candidatus Staskawiczbacteria bacterium RIFCSPHIGHO2_02_FULL_42_22 TaxID=1802207 RepID=A0A1G2I5T9_9BACT|nr:MAG: UDP-N-acetylenolpyruvoylglucosamine reductase [Candidatus Staskawiczbacteria bacterium RIFCSPHIGHO2_02_FULL_42_22]